MALRTRPIDGDIPSSVDSGSPLHEHIKPKYRTTSSSSSFSKHSLFVGLICLFTGVIGTQALILLFGGMRGGTTPPTGIKTGSGKGPIQEEVRTTTTRGHPADHRQRQAPPNGVTDSKVQGPDHRYKNNLFSTKDTQAEASWGDQAKTKPLLINAPDKVKAQAHTGLRHPVSQQQNRNNDVPRRQPQVVTSLNIAHASEDKHTIDWTQLDGMQIVESAKDTIDVPRLCLKSSTMGKNFEDPIRKLTQVMPLAWPDDPVSRKISWDAEHGGALCDTFFGPGFSLIKDVVPPSAMVAPFNEKHLSAESNAKGSAASDPMEEILVKIEGPEDSAYPRSPLQCGRNENLKDSYCIANNIMVDTEKLDVSCGGEPVDEVKGRAEPDEYPTVTKGSMQLLVDPSFPEKQIQEVSANLAHENAKILSGIETVHNVECDAIVKIPVLFVSRAEFANLAMTTTDWYNAWLISRTLKLPRLPIIILDGHSHSILEDTWHEVWPYVDYMKHFNRKMCFRQAIFVPNGYSSPLSRGIGVRKECRPSSFLRSFAHQFTQSLGINTNLDATCTKERKHIVFARRVNYMAHPRHNGQIKPRVNNEEELLARLKKLAADYSRTNGIEVKVHNGVFTSMTVKEQVEMAQEGCLLIGAHGAALAHTLFMPIGSSVLEIQTPGYRRGRFEAYSGWSGLNFYKWSTGSQVSVEIFEKIVIDILDGKKPEYVIRPFPYVLPRSELA